MTTTPAPESRNYRHLKCGTETVISGDSIEMTSNPFSNMSRTWCMTCNGFHPVAEYEWSDTGEKITDYYVRHSSAATSFQRLLCSRTSVVFQDHRIDWSNHRPDPWLGGRELHVSESAACPNWKSGNSSHDAYVVSATLACSRKSESSAQCMQFDLDKSDNVASVTAGGHDQTWKNIDSLTACCASCPDT